MSQQTVLLSLALDHMRNGIVALDAEERIILVNQRVHQLFRLVPGSIRVGHTLPYLLEQVGRSVGWDAERIARVLNNHRLWHAQGQGRTFDHHYDDGTVLRIAYGPRPDGSAVLTYDDITQEREMEKILSGRSAKAERFRGDVSAAVSGVATASQAARCASDGLVAHTTSVRSMIGDVIAAGRQTGGAIESMEAAATEVRGVIHSVITQTDHAVSATAAALSDVRRSDVLSANLTQHAQAIGSIVDMIGALAGQSRLLSLNATIEAARAGDAGHPFRVVAQEVKSLSLQIGRATVAIADQIASVRSAVAEVVEANGAVHRRLDDIHDRAGSIRGSAAATLAQVETSMRLLDELARITSGARDRFRQLDDGNRRLQKSLAEVTAQFDAVGGSVTALVTGAQRFWTDHVDPQQRRATPIAAGA